MAAKKKPAKKAVTKQSTGKAPVKAAPVASIDLSALDPAHDGTTPDAPVAHLVTHARRIANHVRTLSAPLLLAKVTVDDAHHLDALSHTLVGAESAWQTAWAKGAPGAVAKSRGVLLEGRSDLFDALRVFADHDAATQSALDAIAGVESDDDLETDVRRLIPLARKHATDLDGTEITPVVVSGVEAALTAFGAARAGAREVAEGKTTEQALSEAARQAQALRNRAYWALAGHTRTVSARGRFAFRRDAERRALFAGYARASRAAKPAADPAPTKPQA